MAELTIPVQVRLRPWLRPALRTLCVAGAVLPRFLMPLLFRCAATLIHHGITLSFKD